jgi:hypothetical protein
LLLSYEDSLESILIPHGIILDRVEKLAHKIVEESDGPLSVLCVLKVRWVVLAWAPTQSAHS